MPDINSDLELRAAEALKRVNAEAQLPSVDAQDKQSASEAKTAPIPAQENTPHVDIGAHIPYSNADESEYVAPPPSDEEMRKAGYMTSSEIKTDDEDDGIIMSADGGDPNVKKSAEETEETILTSIADEYLPNVDKDARDSFVSKLMPEIVSFRKDLIINQGFTPAEAAKASENRMRRNCSEFAENWAKEHPEGVIVTIDKSQEDNVEFSDEEMRKLQRAKAVKLVVVESAELESLTIKNVDEKVPMSLIRDYCGAISNYSIPLLDRADYATFTGAQSAMLATTVASEDDDMLDLIEKKASVLYKCFAGSVTQPRRDENGKEMSYEDFCNWYHYDDIDMGIYAIVTASTMEVSETTYICQNSSCRKPFTIRYNNKALLDLSEIPQMYKDRLVEIDESRSSFEKMKAIRAKYDVNTRVRSPFSSNVYELGSPTIAEVRERIDKCMNLIDATTVADLVLLIYVKRIWVFDEHDKAYFPPISVQENPADAFEVLCRLHQVDLEMLTRYINEHHYTPSFKIKTKCPHCGREETDPLDVDSMIFLHARASLTEIQ